MLRWLKSFRHLDRTIEVWRCVRRCRRPWPVIRRYLSGTERGYPFHLQLANGVHLELSNFHDLVTAWVVFLRNEYRVPADTRTVLDIGANIGCFSLHAASSHPAARIVAVEPFPGSFSRLSENIRINDFAGRVSCWPLGIAAESGRRVMAAGGPSQFLGVLPSDATVGDGVTIPVVSFEQLLHDACERLQSDEFDFVKLDVEGAEHEALLAAPPAALRRMRRLGMEYHQNSPKGPLFDHLASAGFELEHDRVIAPDVGIAHFRRE